MTPLLFVAIIVTAVIAIRLITGALVRQRSENLADSSVQSQGPLNPGINEQNSWLATWLAEAGYRSPTAPQIFLGATAALTALGLLIILVLGRLSFFDTVARNVSVLPGGIGDILSAAAAAGPYLVMAILSLTPSMIVRAARRKRVESIEEDLAPTLELMATLAEAGLGFDAAISRIQEPETEERPLSSEFRIYQRDALAGIPRTDSLRNMAKRVNLNSVWVFVSALIQAEQAGASLSETLRAQSDDLRDRRKMRALLLAQALPVKLVFPLIFCFLPGIFFSTLGPVLNQFVEVIDSVLRKS